MRIRNLKSINGTQINIWHQVPHHRTNLVLKNNSSTVAIPDSYRGLEVAIERPLQSSGLAEATVRLISLLTSLYGPTVKINLNAASFSYLERFSGRPDLIDVLRRRGYWPTNEETRRLRTLSRSGYHCATRNYAEYLSRIPFDSDGIRRSFGIEYEIYTLTAEQEDKLVGLLETLPACHPERDGSLGSNGVELVFEPMGADDYIRTVKTLKQFIDENNIHMCSSDGNGAGMHTTYGVSNSNVVKSDLQIRCNRLAFMLASVLTKNEIKQMFGRTFGTYRELPRETTSDYHSNAFSCNGRPSTCWECRLPNYNCDPEKMVKFFKASEFIFNETFTRVGFMKVLDAIC